jgi:outer membrane receptor protein involved in Fe transport
MSKTHWLLSGAAFVFASPAFAQTSQEAVPAAQSPAAAGAVQQDDDDQNNVIIVTAQGREQSLQDVPISVNVVDGEQLQNSGGTDIRALNQLAPSLLISSTGSEANGSARIRGVGTVGDNPGLESSVAVFVDGVYRSRSGIGLNELGEIDRIEVLRGPQGTLFGRNASAGLIHIISRLPQFETGGMAELTYGNYNYVRGQMAITGPVSDTIAARFDGVYLRRDGFLEVVNPTGGTEDRVNDRNRLFTRGQVLFQPNDALSVRLIGDYTYRKESCCGATYLEVREAIDPTPGVPGDFQYITGENRIVSLLKLLGGTLSSAGDPFNRRINVTPGRTYINETRDWGFSGELNYDFGGAKLTSITSYRGYYSEGAGDFDYGNVDIVYRANDGNTFREFQTLTQELRLQGSAFNDRLNWLVGAYYANEDLTIADNIRFGTQYGAFAACRVVAGTGATRTPAAFQDPTKPGCLSTVAPGAAGGLPPGVTFRQAFAGNPAFGGNGAAIVGGLDRLSTLNDLGDAGSRYFQGSTNYAFFTHNIFNITDQLSLTLGGRYTMENKDFRATFNNTNTVCPAQQTALGSLFGSTNAASAGLAQLITILTCTGNSSSQLNALNLQDEFDEDEFSGTAVLSYQPTRDILAYASYSRGYKAGGYNLDRSDLGLALFPRTNADVKNLRFAPEINNAVELGFKLTQPGFTFAAAAFQQRFRDFQLNTFNGLVFIVQNINGCSNLVGGPGADSDALATTGTCAAADVESGVVSTGVELEATFRPFDQVVLNLGYTYVSTEYADDLVGSNTGEALDPALFLLAGDNLSNAPEHVATASFAWTPRLGNNGLSGLFYLDARYTSSFNTGSDLFFEKEQPSTLVVNGRIGIRGPDQRWSLELWAQNLLDEDYTQVAFNLPFQSSTSSANTTAQITNLNSPLANGLYGAYLAEPRTFGLTGRFRF